MSSTVDSHKTIGKRCVTAAIHVIFVVIICILPEMLMSYASSGRSHHQGMPWWFYAKSGMMIAVFYINYSWLIDKTIMRESPRWWRFVTWNVLLIVMIVGAMWLVNSLGDTGHSRRLHVETNYRVAASMSFFLRDVIMLLLSVLLALSLRVSSRWVDMERRAEQIATERKAMELNGLRQQLNPHFLFNTLNSIYALIEIAPKEARRAVHELSQLLRYVVYENPAEVELGREIEFIENYVELMRLRLGSRPVYVDIDVKTTRTLMVTPLLFVTLVENAFKHGVTACESDGVSISLKADDEMLEFTTRNHIDAGARHDRCRDSGGVGHANLRRSLELIYGRRATLTTDDDGQVYVATIKIMNP